MDNEMSTDGIVSSISFPKQTSYWSVSKEDPNYKMDHPRRGRALIFNFDKFKNSSRILEPREGSEKDRDDLKACLIKLQFDVEVYDNLKSHQLRRILKKVQKDDHTDADCLLVTVMTHGHNNYFYTSDGYQVPVNALWSNFTSRKCPTLAGKPKIFIIQSCRGEIYDEGWTLGSPKIPKRKESRKKGYEVDSGSFSYMIPNAGDIIVAFSCPEGHLSLRCSEKGSWFIQSICKVFNLFAYEMDLQMLFTTVAREVALNYETEGIPSLNIKKKGKQVTSTSSTLIRTVKFSPKLTSESSVLVTLVEIENANIISTPLPTSGVQPILAQEINFTVIQQVRLVSGSDEDKESKSKEISESLNNKAVQTDAINSELEDSSDSDETEVDSSSSSSEDELTNF